MSKPVVAIPADIREIEGNVWQATPNQYVRAAVKGADVTVFLVPALEADNDFDGILDRVDGLLVSGSRTNVHPSLYGKEATDAEGPYDRARDATSLPLIRRAIERGIPLLAICRGIQELNVALGGTLMSEVQDQPGRMDHRFPPAPTQDGRFAIRHDVEIVAGGCLGRLVAPGAIAVNSLHRQAVGRLSDRLVVEAAAPDGTIEAVSVRDAPGFTLGVQWHPEYWAASDGPSQAILTGFGAAVAEFAGRR